MLTADFKFDVTIQMTQTRKLITNVIRKYR